MRLKLTIAYDGTNYEGWQVQKIGVGVQQKIEEAIAKIFQAQIRLHGSSRTAILTDPRASGHEIGARARPLQGCA